MTVSLLPGPTVAALIASVGGGSIVNDNEADPPPPGAGFTTDTSAEPADWRSLADSGVVNVRALTTDVGRGVPFHCKTEKALKPLPVTVNTTGAAPALTLAGDSDSATGTGLPTVEILASAWSIRMRGVVRRLPIRKRLSTIGVPVCLRAVSTVPTEAAGRACLMSAHAPAT